MPSFMTLSIVALHTLSWQHDKDNHPALSFFSATDIPEEKYSVSKVKTEESRDFTATRKIEDRVTAMTKHHSLGLIQNSISS